MDGITINLVYDQIPRNPREECGTLTTMVCWHPSYILGDPHDWASPEDYKREASELHGGLELPLYLLDHSGLTIQTEPFGCPWDSGQVGWIFVNKKQFLSDTGSTRLTPSLRKKAIDLMINEVELYDFYLRGDMWGIVIAENCPCCGQSDTVIESCWGFFGNDPLQNGMLECIPRKYHDMVKEGNYETVY